MINHLFMRSIVATTIVCAGIASLLCGGKPSYAEDRTEVAPARVPLRLLAPIQDKNFFLLSLLERDNSVQQTLWGSAVLRAARDRTYRALEQTLAKSSSGDASSLAEALFTPQEIAEIGAELSRLYNADAHLRQLVDGPLRTSGMAEKYHAETGPALLAKTWQDCAAGINNIVAVYGLGKDGRSPAIDSISYDAKSFLYGALLHNVFGILLEEKADTDLFFQPALKLALTLLDINRRDEAGRFEPLEQGENRAAFRRIRSIAWERYPYTVIVVPGYGPEEKEVHLSPIGKLQLRLAARRYREGKAPFLLVSGGFVHPKQSPYCEAYEMKQALIKDFGIPENAILVDPHARHTTTNLRNAARMIYRYGMPFDKPGLITTNTYQSADIESKAFQTRCQNVFGYQPFVVVKRTSPFDLEFLPHRDSLYADPLDPLDP